MKLITLGIIFFVLCFNDALGLSKYRQTVLDNIEKLRNTSRIPPNPIPFQVNVSAYVGSIHDIDERSSEFGFDMFIFQQWYDSRYEYATNESEDDPDEKVLLYPEEFLNNKMWLPSLTFSSVKVQEIHNSFEGPYSSLKIKSDGHITFRFKSHVVIICSMKYDTYPMDYHTCEARLRSFMLKNDEMILKWSDWGAYVSKKADIHSYHKPEWEHGDCSRSWGNYSCISIIFKFQRNPAQYVLMTYIPSAILICITYLILWLPIDELLSKIVLGGITTLSMVLLIAFCQYGSPLIGHAKAVDKWLTACFIFNTFFIIFSLICSLVSRRSNGKRSDNFELLEEDNSPNSGRPVAVFTVTRKMRILLICSKVAYPLLFLLVILAKCIIIYAQN